MGKYIKIYHVYEKREIENAFRELCRVKPYPKNPDLNKLWTIGVKVWGEKFLKKECF